MQNVSKHAGLDLARSFVSLVKIEEVADNRYSAKLVETASELESVLRLRFDVFKRELSDNDSLERESGIDFDKYDLHCEHLIVTDRETGETVGTYRLNTIERARTAGGFYAYTEFSIEDLPKGFLENSIELGRACIAREHRNSRVLFMLWKGLANYLTVTKKRFLFGCCSIFTQDGDLARTVLDRLKTDGSVHDAIVVSPRPDRTCLPEDFVSDGSVEFDLPALVKIYLRIGAKVCGEPAIDREFKTIDYFVVFDVETINRKYLKMFFGDRA
ncbi:MAG: GNAT family N-acetyltransferase [Pyrinomonadaceae bacterium]|nr:GNAT family N-acetyltransferase [Pyrinomonadaceae bacterium]